LKKPEKYLVIPAQAGIHFYGLRRNDNDVQPVDQVNENSK